jgi:hypothetical protein
VNKRFLKLTALSAACLGTGAAFLAQANNNVAEADAQQDTGLFPLEGPTDDSQVSVEDTSIRVYQPDGTYTLSTANEFTVGDQFVVGPVTWEYVGPMVFSDGIEHGGPQTPTDAAVTLPPHPTTQEFMSELIMWDAEGHKFHSVSVDMSVVADAIGNYNASNSTDKQASGQAATWPTAPPLAPGDSWQLLSYDTWSHRFSQYPGFPETVLNGRFKGDWQNPSSSWWTKIADPSQVVEHQTDAVVSAKYCSGVLIEQDLVLTARHCVLDYYTLDDTAQETSNSWCTRGNLEGMGGNCVQGERVITADFNNASNLLKYGLSAGAWQPSRDWALIRLSAPLVSAGETEATTMVLSLWEDQTDAAFEPEILGGPIMAGPMNRCDSGESDWDDECDNLRYAQDDPNAIVFGRYLYHREEGDVFVTHQYRSVVEYDAMFGSADSGAPVFWDGEVPGGRRYVVSIVSMAAWTPGSFVHLRGPRIYDWRDEIIAQAASL